MSEQNHIPTSHLIISILAILWNLFGVASFSMHAMMSAAQIAEMPVEQQPFMQNFPDWAFVVFGAAVTTGLLGSIGLLMKKKWSILLFIISLIAILINQLYPFITPNYVEAFGGLTTVIWLPLAIIGIAIALYFYSKSCDSKGWLQ